MSKRRDELVLSQMPETVAVHCREWAEQAGWRCAEESQTQIVCREPFRLSFDWPAKIEVHPGAHR